MSAIEEMKLFVNKVNNHPEHIAEEKRRGFQFDIKNDRSVQIIIEEGSITLYEEKKVEPDLTLTLSEGDLMKLLKDELNTTMAFMTGKVKVDGKIGLALKLQELVRKYQSI
ncbi:hypothetical protein JCM9140_414 [Halalkalibacter wakoensis JCM 9140]|uniref:SCP2 domain-containing protein n=1 Tax=Halalkalibacter wakoensis JCM 9140 TaxID=1236970 RepID=W4PXC2_9BACI|nr:SCP2 sterol-binding domain-containing protein [Halalkalibacter wakoensis]GAE24481.1 hypothetical protein JCM9140_414 [Halalkalibacter wakoensis JCM 9140]